MNGPTAADCRASRRGGIKVAVLAAIGLAAMVAAAIAHHDGIAVAFAVATITGVLAEGRPRAARARRRWPL